MFPRNWKANGAWKTISLPRLNQRAACFPIQILKMACATCASSKLSPILVRGTSGWRLNLDPNNSSLGKHRASHQVSPNEKCPHQQRDQQIPREEPIVTPAMRNQTDGSEHCVMTDKGHVPNRIQEFTVDRSLRDIEHA